MVGNVWINGGTSRYGQGPVREMDVFLPDFLRDFSTDEGATQPAVTSPVRAP